MSSNATCAQCGRELTRAEQSLRLCPQCLLAAALPNAGIEPPSPTRHVSEQEHRRFVPPEIDALDRAIPHLEFVALLGSGGMGAVYQARQPALDRPIAVKVLAPGGGATPVGTAEQFQLEAQTLARLNHPHIVTIYNYGYVQPWHYLEMEYVSGPSLRSVLRSGGLAIGDVLRVGVQVAEALHHAHQLGVIHRDVKPENLLLIAEPDAGPVTVKLADFGIAKLMELDRESSAETDELLIAGTPQYVAPELLLSRDQVSPRTDIYALGVVLAELATGTPPDTRRAANCCSGIQELDHVLDQCLARDPSQRYSSAAALADDLRGIESAVVEAVGTDAIGPSIKINAGSKSKWKKLAIGLSPPVLVLAVLGLGEWCVSSPAVPESSDPIITDSAPELKTPDGETKAEADTENPITLSNPKWYTRGFEQYLRVDYERVKHVMTGRRVVLVVEAANGRRYEDEQLGHWLADRGTLRASFLGIGHFPGPYEVFLEHKDFGLGSNRVRISNILELPAESTGGP